MKGDKPIGYLVASATGYKVAGSCCRDAAAADAAPVYWSNVYPYRQSCMACGRQLVVPQSEAWPELFDGR